MRFFRFGDCISYYVSGVQRTESGVNKVIYYPKDPYLPENTGVSLCFILLFYQYF